MMDQDNPVVEDTERKSNEREILIEEANMGLKRNLVLGKCPGI